MMKYRKKRKHNQFYSLEELLDLILPHLEYQQDKRASNGDYLCKCVFHRHNHLDKYKMNVGLNGWYCNSAGVGGSLGELARHLRIKLNSNTEAYYMDAIEVNYDYTDENDVLLFQVVRRPGKKFLQRRFENDEIVWNLNGVRRVPYRLKELIESTERTEQVFICEGEKDVDNIRKLDLTATCNSGGAGKWKKEYCDYLKGRDLVLLPDNDEPGKAHMQQVAEMCSSTANSIRIIDLPGLSEKQDISDWLEKGHTKEELLELVESTDEWKPDDNFPSNVNEISERENIATQLIHQILDSGVYLFQDQRQEAYIFIDTEDGKETLQVESTRFRHWLTKTSWDHFGKAVASETIRNTQNQLASIAVFEGPVHELDVRCAIRDGAIYIDLDGKKAVKIDEEGWDIKEPSRPIFRHYPQMKSLPEPKRGGDLKRILKYLNIKDKDSESLFMSYLVVGMVPSIPIPALIIHGVQGSAKTTMLKITKSVLDPSRILVRGIVPDQREFSLAAWRNRALFFDNLNSVPDWFSDALCRMVTGEGYESRKLYSDEDTVFFEYSGLVGLAGINLVANKSDLLDRSIIVELNPIGPDERRLEREFWNEFDRDLPSILGGLCTNLSDTLRISCNVNRKRLPRMADFAHYGAAAAEVMGGTADNFMLAYEKNINRQNEAAIESSPVAQAVISFMEDQNEWVGTSTKLLSEINDVAQNLQIDMKSRQWPKEPGWLSRRLREIEPNLENEGIQIQYSKERTGRMISLTKNDNGLNNLTLELVDDIETTDSGDDVA